MAGFNNNGFNSGDGFNPEGGFNPGGIGGGFNSGQPDNPAFYGRNSGKKKMFIPALIVTILYGILWFFLGELIVNNLFNKIWNPIAVAVYVLAFVIPLIGILLLLSRAAENLSRTAQLWGTGKAIGWLALSLAVTFLLTMALEFIYELDNSLTTPKTTSYVFVIDDSGSMSVNDPDNLRVEAIGEIMKKEDIPYCVYKFSEDAELIHEMSEYDQNDVYEFNSDGGGTNILQSLYTVSQDMKDPGFGGGERPKVLLLSDGESYDDGLAEVMREFVDLNVVVSTVGFGQVNTSLMQGIADRTGGIYVYCDDLNALSTDMEQAITSGSTRTLLTPRSTRNNQILLLIMRILFLTMIGSMIGVCKGRGAFSDIDLMRIIVFTAGQSLIAGILCEVLVNSHQGIARLLVDILWAATVMYQLVINFPSFGGDGTPHGLNQKVGQNRHTRSVGGQNGPGNGNGRGYNNQSGGFNNGSGFNDQKDGFNNGGGFNSQNSGFNNGGDFYNQDGSW